MNQPPASASPGSSLAGVMAALTTAHLVLIALLALLVVAGIAHGARIRRRRRRAEREVLAHAREAGMVAEPAAAPAAPSPAPAPAPVPAGAGDADGPVGQLKGLGPKVQARLAELGITRVGQLAALDHDAGQRLDAELGPFRGRLERDRWIEQARFLAAGDRAGFEAVFGKL